jgi:hypothetical protein
MVFRMKRLIIAIIIASIICIIIVICTKEGASCKITSGYLSSLQKMELVNKELSNNQYNLSIGIVALGLFNASKNWSVYTDSIQGIANISKLSGVSTIGYNHSGSSLQLNSVLLSCVNKAQKVYWLQDVARLDSYTNKLEFIENTWNISSNSTILLTSYSQSKSIPYELPLNLSLLINISNERDGTIVNFYYGIYNKANRQWNYTLYKKLDIYNTTRSRIVIAPSITPINNMYYDSEFVFAGPGDGSIEYFSALNAYLSLYYLNDTSDSYVVFPQYFTKGLDTGEVSYDLKSTMLKDKAIVQTDLPSVTIGNVVAVNSSD